MACCSAATTVVVSVRTAWPTCSAPAKDNVINIGICQSNSSISSSPSTTTHILTFQCGTLLLYLGSSNVAVHHNDCRACSQLLHGASECNVCWRRALSHAVLMHVSLPLCVV